ncbi:DNA polymerase III, delta' subunit [Nitrospira sp. KM1]|uniref:DNA polymerase III subunit delta' n=1 Tax=Nitrospira sp. KM1 TaxID=1936990 RepID=UPI0013A7478C|nr:DNA polymerase III subunit delta' [Nitrospira sp. KM1]BCA54169.1 DNA polymerase III, delta' subunit [Nitrospira sp. KM1]
MPLQDVIGHAAVIASIQRAEASNRLAHAYLFHGEASIGKRLTAVRLTQAFHCEQRQDGAVIDACGVCRSCRHVEASTHPDFLVIEPDSEQAVPQIKIEQIREIEQQIMYRPLIAERKICLIDQADRMTIGAANALLKTLEEPPDHSLFFLISSRPAALPVTIRSRCQALRFTTPPRTQVEAALILKREIPPSDTRLLAIISEGRLGDALVADPAEIRARQREVMELIRPQTLGSVTAILAQAESSAKSDRVPELLSWLTRWIRDVIILQVGGDRDHILFAEDLETLEMYSKHADTDALLDILCDIEQTDRQATRHLNLQMALEQVLLRLRDACTAQPVSQRS